MEVTGLVAIGFIGVGIFDMQLVCIEGISYSKVRGATWVPSSTFASRRLTLQAGKGTLDGELEIFDSLHRI